MHDTRTEDWRSYVLERSGGFARERVLVSIVDRGSNAPGRFPFAPVPFACDRQLPRWFVSLAFVLVVVLVASFAAMMLSAEDHLISNLGMWGFGISIPAIILLAIAMAIAPIRVYRLCVPIDARQVEPPILTIRQRAIGHRKYVVKDNEGNTLARIRRTPSAGHLRIDRFGDEEFNPISVRVRIARRVTGEKVLASLIDVGAGISNLIHPPWKSAAFLARHLHDPRPRDEVWPLAVARREGRRAWLHLTPSAAEGAPPEAVPSDIVLLAAACLLFSLEGDR